MGVTKREQEMIDLSERGLSTSQIAERLGLRHQTVASALSRLAMTDAGDRAWNGMVARGSQGLLAAIRRHHPEWCQ